MFVRVTCAGFNTGRMKVRHNLFALTSRNIRLPSHRASQSRYRSNLIIDIVAWNFNRKMMVDIFPL